MAKKTFTAEFKSKVAIEAVKGNKTIPDISAEFEIKKNTLSKAIGAGKLRHAIKKRLNQPT